MVSKFNRHFSVFLLFLVSALVSLGWTAQAGPVPKDPVYMRMQNGWKGLFPHGEEYAEYAFTGQEVKLQDPYHALLTPKLGVMVTFADKSRLAQGPDLLAAHIEWELAYWRKHASKVESTSRPDLSGARTDLRTTEIRLYNNAGEQLTVYLLSLASQDGVFVLAISCPGKGADDVLIKEVAGSFKLVHHTLDAEELSRQRALAVRGS